MYAGTSEDYDAQSTQLHSFATSELIGAGSTPTAESIPLAPSSGISPYGSGTSTRQGFDVSLG
jgi:hypothetical protein